MSLHGVQGTGLECRYVWDLMDALGAADPSPQVLAASAEHFAHCANCAGVEQSLEEVLVLYRSQENIAIPGGLEQRLLDCLCGGKTAPNEPPGAAPGSTGSI